MTFINIILNPRSLQIMKRRSGSIDEKVREAQITGGGNYEI